MRIILIAFSGILISLCAAGRLHSGGPVVPVIALAAVIGTLALIIINRYLHSKQRARELAGMRAHIRRMQLGDDQ